MTVTFARIDETGPARIAERALAALGQTRQQTAETLAAAGHTGLRSVAGACPVARYLLAADPALTGVAVDDYEARLDRCDESVWVPLPLPVERFVLSFDLGFYPHLIAASPQHNPLVDPGTTGGTETAS